MLHGVLRARYKQLELARKVSESVMMVENLVAVIAVGVLVAYAAAAVNLTTLAI